MSKFMYEGEFEIKSSKSILFPFISTAAGLSQWFANDVNFENISKTIIFNWESDQLKAKMRTVVSNKHVKFTIINDDKKESDPNFFDFKLNTSELTQSVYLKVLDYSEMQFDEADKLWNSLINDLKELIGG